MIGWVPSVKKWILVSQQIFVLCGSSVTYTYFSHYRRLKKIFFFVKYEFLWYRVWNFFCHWNQNFWHYKTSTPDYQIVTLLDLISTFLRCHKFFSNSSFNGWFIGLWETFNITKVLIFVRVSSFIYK